MCHLLKHYFKIIKYSYNYNVLGSTMPTTWTNCSVFPKVKKYISLETMFENVEPNLIARGIRKTYFYLFVSRKSIDNIACVTKSWKSRWGKRVLREGVRLKRIRLHLYGYYGDNIHFQQQGLLWNQKNVITVCLFHVSCL